MDTITVLGVLSLLLCVGITWRGATIKSKQPGQSIRDSLEEAWTNIVFGFGLNYMLNLWLLPLQGATLGGEFTFWSNWWMGWIYTTGSFVRQFLVRRYWNWKAQRKHAHEIKTQTGPQ